MLHSLLTEDAQGWAIEAISPEPPLIVNGTGCRRQRLCDGDVLEVGPFRFRFSAGGSGSQATHLRRYPRIAVEV